MRGLGKIERRLAVDFMAHFGGVIRVVAPDTKDAAHGKAALADYGDDGCLTWRKNGLCHGDLDQLCCELHGLSISILNAITSRQDWGKTPDAGADAK